MLSLLLLLQANTHYRAKQALACAGATMRKDAGAGKCRHRRFLT
jgi:hypothetical protein